jgi:tRNA-modifying protein YgfZ
LTHNRLILNVLENMISADNLRFYPYRPAAWLRINGEDAGAYLQGQFSQDLKGLVAPKSAYGLWLNQKGKIIADSFIVGAPTAGEFWVGSYFCSGAAISERLESYIVADDVSVADETSRWHGMAVLGPGAEAWVAQAAIPGAVAFAGRRCIRENWECLWPAESSAAMQQRMADRVVGSADDLERERIAAGIPAIPRDAGPADLPPEAGLPDAAISYTKGCYLGQEVIARLKTRGRVRRNLCHVRGSGAIPPFGAALWLGEKKIGQLRSAIGDLTGDSFAGLAMVAVDVPADAALGVSAGAEETPPADARLRFCV